MATGTRRRKGRKDAPPEIPEDASMRRGQLKLSYDGPSLRDGTMDVQDLAPALLAFGQLIQEANRELNKDKAAVVVRVRADLLRGSVITQIDIVQSTWGFIRDIFSSPGADALSNLFGILGIGSGLTGGLLWLLKQLRGRPAENVRPIGDGRVEVTINNNTIIIDQHTVNLYNNPVARVAAAGVVAPLQRPGIDEFEVSIHDEITQRIVKSEAAWFAPPETVPLPAGPDQILVGGGAQMEMALEVERVDFVEGKYKVNHGAGSAQATVADQAFRADIETHKIRFGKGDIIRAMVTMEQHTTPTGQVRAEVTIHKVLEHRHAAVQELLPLWPTGKKGDGD